MRLLMVYWFINMVALVAFSIKLGESPFMFDRDNVGLKLAASCASPQLSLLSIVESETETCVNSERLVSSGGYGVLKNQNYLLERPALEVRSGLFVAKQESVVVVDKQGIVKVKNIVHIDDSFLNAEESQSFLKMVENDVTFVPHPEPGWFQYTYVNVNEFPKLANNQTFVERICEKLGVNLANAKLPEHFRVKKFLPGSMAPLHVDNKGEWDVSVVIYFANSSASPLAFPNLNLSVEARSGRAVVFLNRDDEGNIDLESAHHTIKTTEGVKYSVGFTFRVETNKNKEYFTNFNPFRSGGVLSNSIVTFHHCATCGNWQCGNGLACQSGVPTTFTGGCSHCEPDGTRTLNCGAGTPTPGYTCLNGDCVQTNCRKFGRSPEDCRAFGPACRYLFPTNSAFNDLSKKRMRQCRKLGDFGCRAVNDCKFKCKDVCLADKTCRAKC